MSSLSNNHILFNNYSLSNNRIQIVDMSFLDGSSQDVQSIPITRGIGSSVVRRRTENRIIKITAGTTATSPTQNEDSALLMSEYVKKIFYRDKTILRTTPKSKVINLNTCQSLGGWAVASDGGSLSVDTKEFQFENASLLSTVTPSTGSAVYTLNSATQINLSSVSNSGNFEFWLDLSDVYSITSINFRVGSDSSNYYLADFTTNYEGEKLQNGSNYFSVPWGNAVQGKTIAQEGTPVNTAIDYIRIQINFTPTANLFQARLGGFFHVDEEMTRNYPSILMGGINFEQQWFLNVGNLKNNWQLDLMNYAGYSQATHDIVLFAEYGITTLTRTKSVDLKGNFSPLITNQFRLNAITNLNFLTYSNFSKNESINWNKTWVANDNLIFDAKESIVSTNGMPQDFIGAIPKANLGVNYLNLSITQSSNTIISQLTGTLLEISSTRFGGQSFVAPISGTLTSVTLFNKVYSWDPEKFKVKAELRTDNAGTPSNTILSSLTVSEIINIQGLRNFSPVFNFNFVVTAGVTYWITQRVDAFNGGFTNSNWYYLNASAVAGNRATSTSATGIGSWTASAGTDYNFNLAIEPTPATDIDWTARYKPLYI